MTQAQNLANLSQDYGVIPMSNRNLFVDGALDVWTGPAAVALPSGGYGAAVMWRSICGAGGAGTLQLGGGGGSVLGGVPYNYAVFSQTTASTGSPAASTAPAFYQTIENVATASGRSVTFSVTMQLASGGPVTIPSIICRQFFGSGGSPSATVVVDKTVNWVVGAAVKRYSVRLDLPGVQGMNRGTQLNDAIQIGMWFPPGVTFVLSIQQLQVELSNPFSSSDINGNGGEPTAFEYRGQQAELARTQRYYHPVQTFTTVANAPFVGTNIYARAWYAVTMRAAPAVTWTPAGSSGVQTPTVTDNTLDGATAAMSSTVSGNCFYQVTNYIADARL